MAAKVKDGLFVGDSESAADQDFLELNKISNLANFACTEVPNVWSSHGLVYQSHPWEDKPDYDLFALSTPSDGNHRALLGIIDFIDSSIAHGISVMVFSRRGTGRAIAALCAYFMGKFGWGVEKALDYIFAKKPDTALNKGFVQQLKKLEALLLAARRSFLARIGVGLSDEAVLTHETMRRAGWECAYLLPPYRELLAGRIALPHRRALQAGGRAPSLEAINRHYTLFLPSDADVADELLCVNSHANSLLTLRALPGPYPNAYDKIKSFKIRFHPVVQHAGTPASSPAISRQHSRARSSGILKTGSRVLIGQPTEDSWAGGGTRVRSAWADEGPAAAPTVHGPSSSSARSRDDDSMTSDLSSADPISTPQSYCDGYPDEEADRTRATDRALPSADSLYGFVGMGRGSYRGANIDSAADEKKYVAAASAAASKGDPYWSSSRPGSKQSNSLNYTSLDSSGNDNYSSYEDGSKAPSLYDLANMHITASFRPLSSLGPGPAPIARNDPLAAFDLPSGPVRGNHGVSTSSRSRPSLTDRAYARQPSAASIASTNRSVASLSSRRGERSDDSFRASPGARKKSGSGSGSDSSNSRGYSGNSVGSSGSASRDSTRGRAREAERKISEEAYISKTKKWR